MARFNLSFVILLCVLYCSRGNPINKNEFSEATDKMLATFQIYNKDVDQSIPWKRLKTDLSSINLRYDFHSSTATGLLNKIRKQISAGVDSYYESSSIMYEWAAYASSSLNIYLTLLNSNQYNGTDFIVNVLDDGIGKINATIPLLEQVSRNFRSASDDLESLSQEFTLTKLHKKDEYLFRELELRLHAYVGGGTALLVIGLMASILTAAFCLPCSVPLIAGVGAGTTGAGLGATALAVELKGIPDIEKLIQSLHDQYNTLSVAVKKTSANIDDTIEDIRREINRLGDMRSSIKQTNQYIDDSLLPAIQISAKNLIKKCDEYIAAHK